MFSPQQLVYAVENAEYYPDLVRNSNHQGFDRHSRQGWSGGQLFRNVLWVLDSVVRWDACAGFL